MKSWICTSAAALVAVAGLAAAASAVEPWSSPPMRGSPARTPVFPTAHSWANSMRQEATPAPAPAAGGPALRPAIAGSNSIGQGGNERAVVGSADYGGTIAATAWNGEHQYTGYVYSPGACDHTPPCVDHLWDGYCQRPCRCNPHGHHFHRGHGMGCSTCNSGCGHGGCHGFHGLHGFKHHFRGSSCCAPACNTCSTGCGHGHGGGLFSGMHRGWFGSLCDSFDGGMSCGCAAPVGSGPAGDAPKAESIPTPAAEGAPAVPPPADDAKSARGFKLYIPWSIK